MTFAATQRIDGDGPPDDIPTATDGTPAPTPPRRASHVEVVKEGASGKRTSSPSSTDAPDRLLNDQEQNDIFDQWTALGGKSTQLKAYLLKHFQRADLAEIKLSELDGLAAGIQEELAA